MLEKSLRADGGVAEASVSGRIEQARLSYDRKLSEVEKVLAEVASKLIAAEAHIEERFNQDMLRRSSHDASPADDLADMSGRPTSLAELVEMEARLEERVAEATAHLEELLCDEHPSTEVGLVEAEAKLTEAKLRMEEQLGMIMAHLDEKLTTGTAKMTAFRQPDFQPEELRSHTGEPEAETSPLCQEQLGGEWLEERFSAVSDMMQSGFAQVSLKIAEAQEHVEGRATSRLEERLRDVFALLAEAKETQKTSLEKCMELVDRRLDNRLGVSNPRFAPQSPTALPTPRHQSPPHCFQHNHDAL